jgi:formylmethanofuran dehydrogenase subunit E
MMQERRELVQELREKELIEEVDFTRDGYQTIVLSLPEPDGECQRCGDPYDEDDHDHTDEYPLCWSCFEDAREKTHTGRMARTGRER